MSTGNSLTDTPLQIDRCWLGSMRFNDSAVVPLEIEMKTIIRIDDRLPNDEIIPCRLNIVYYIIIYYNTIVIII